jgi:hypothetical protein
MSAEGMNTLNQESWDVLERYLCSLTLNQQHHELRLIKLSQRVDVKGYIFTPGTYVKESQSNQTDLNMTLSGLNG